jgi:hypothetical protein
MSTASVKSLFEDVAVTHAYPPPPSVDDIQITFLDQSNKMAMVAMGTPTAAASVWDFTTETVAATGTCHWA